MAENNEQDNKKDQSIGEQTANSAKGVALGIIKTAALHLIIPLIIFILILTLISSFVYVITKNNGTYNEDDWGNVPYAASAHSKSATVNSDGTVSTSTTAQETWDTLEENGSQVAQYLDSPEELQKLMNAELITQFPDTRPNPTQDIDWSTVDLNSTTIQGIIKFQRRDSDNNSYFMSYVDNATFQGYIDTYNSSGSEEARNNALQHFTMESETTTTTDDEGNEVELNEYYVVVATWKEKTYTVVTNDADGATDAENKIGASRTSNEDGTFTITRTEYEMTTTKINYKDFVEKYTMPFQYLWAFMVVGNDKDFVMQLADLVYDSEIVITVYDNLTTTINEQKYEYKKQQRTDTLVWIKVNYGDTETDHKYIKFWKPDDVDYSSELAEGETLTSTEDPDYADIQNCETTYTVTDRVNTLSIDLSLADTWIQKFTRDFAYQSPTENVTTSEATEPATEFILKNEYDSDETNAHASEYREEVKAEEQEWLENNKSSSQVQNLLDSESINEVLSNHNFTINDFINYIENNYPRYVNLGIVSDMVNNFYGIVETSSTINDVINRLNEYTYENNPAFKDLCDILSSSSHISAENYGPSLINIYQNIIVGFLGEEAFEELKNSVNPEVEKVKVKEYQRNYGDQADEAIKRTDTNTVRTQKYTSSPSTVTPKIDDTTAPNFVTIYNAENTSKNRNYLLTASSWLFEILEDNPDTADMVDLTRYLMYCATGTSFGVTEFDFSIFDEENFSSMGSSAVSGSKIAELLKSYENESLRRYMSGESDDYSSVSRYVTQDRTKYKMYYTDFDGCWNFSYGIMVYYKNTSLNNVAYFEAEGYNLQELVNRAISGETVEVDVEVIDRIFLNLVNDKRTAVKTNFASQGIDLPDNQIDALVNIMYQYGNYGQGVTGENNIYTLYKTYYQQGQQEEFKNRAVARTSSRRNNTNIYR